jgi:hypothetical protein
MIILIALFLWWASPRPVDPATVQVTVTGGVLTRTTTFLGGASGEVWIDAPRECASITWEAKTKDGVGLRTVQTWYTGCDKLYLPLF